MRNASRLWKFIWPQRAWLAWSTFFALIVAALWGTNLSVVFPVVKVVIEEENLHDWANREIVACREKIEQTDKRIHELDPNRFDRRTRAQERLTDEHKRLAGLIWVRDNVLPHVPSDNFQAILLISAVFLVATIIRGICTVIQTVLVGGVVQRSSMRLRIACLRHCLTLDHQTIRDTGSTQLIARLTNDVRELAGGLQVFGVRLVREPLKAASCVTLALLWNWRLTLLSMVFAPVIAVILGYCGKQLKRAAKASLQSLSGIYKVVSETFQHAPLVIATNGGRRQRRLFHEQNKAVYKHQMRGVRISALISPTNEILGVMAASAAILPALFMVFRNTNEFWGIRLASRPVTVADVALLYMFLAGTLDPIHKLSGIYRDWKKASAAADRVFAIFDQQTRVVEPATPVRLPRIERNIRVESVSYGYPGRDKTDRLVLTEANLEIAAGEVVAIVGPNGSGKSTLASLLMRFIDPLSGSIRIDGIDLTRVSTKELRSQIGFVMQETLLFDASVRENILYGDTSASDEQVLHAAERAHVDAFLNQMPNGIDSSVGENGCLLSGGQRQRIALARALVRDPAILILDEATSAIDSHSEALIYESLQNCRQNRTVLIITHTLSPALLDLVDRLVVIEGGRIVASGTHDELLESCPTYHRLNKSASNKEAA